MPFLLNEIARLMGVVQPIEFPDYRRCLGRVLPELLFFTVGVVAALDEIVPLVETLEWSFHLVALPVNFTRASRPPVSEPQEAIPGAPERSRQAGMAQARGRL